MSKKFDDFVTALKHLCIEHSVYICPSEYDFLLVWDAENGDQDLIVEDRTCTR